MNRTRSFFKNAILLSVVSLILRAAAVSFNAYVTGKIGAECMGLFTLVMSVYGFAVTVATSAVNLAAVRLTAARCGELGTSSMPKKAYRYAMAKVCRAVCSYSALFGFAAGFILFLGADFIGTNLLGDGRTVLSLRILAVSLPAISLSSALSGYFTGIRKVYKNAAVSITEQGVKILVTTTALALLLPYNSVEYACLAVVGGSALAEAWSLVLCILLYLTDSKAPADAKISDKEIELEGKSLKKLRTTFRDAAEISLPTAVGAYLRQGLNTAEHLAIPAGLRRRGASQTAALASYGALNGMAMPLVLFPYAVIGSFTGLLVPEVTECAAVGDHARIRRITKRVFDCTAICSIAAAGLFFTFADPLGTMIYNNAEAGHYIRIMGLLVPFMYLDTACDAILKGLGEQVYIMKINTIDSAASLLLVLLLTPILGLNGYILTVWLCEILNLAASIRRLKARVGDPGSAFSRYLPPVTAVTIAILAVNFTTRLFPAVNPGLLLGVYLAVVGLTLVLYKKLTKEKNTSDCLSIS